MRQGLAVVSAIVLARLLDPSGNGLVAMVMIFTESMDLCNDAGLSAATIQRKDINDQQVSTLFWINVALGTVLTLILAAMAPLIAWVNSQPRLVPITIALSTSFMLGSLTEQHNALLRRQITYAGPALIGIIFTVVSPSVGVAAALTGLDY